MILSGTVTVCRATAERIAAAAEEYGHTTSRQAALAIEAAARLFAMDRGTSAVPGVVDERSVPVVSIPVSLHSRWLVVIADAALEHSFALEAQLRAVLDASVKGYALPKPIVMIEASPVKRAKAVPRIPPFDAAYFAKHAAAFK